MPDENDLEKFNRERADERLSDRIAAIEKCLFANGRPSLEDRLRAEIREQFTHKHNQSLQVIANTKALTDMRLEQIEKTSEERHEENKLKLEENGDATATLAGKVSEIKDKVIYAAGAAAVLVVIGTALIQHYWK